MAANDLKVCFVTRDKRSTDTTRRQCDQDIESQLSDLRDVIVFTPAQHAKYLGCLHPMRFGRRKSPAAPSQIRHKSVFEPSPGSPQEFMQHHGRTTDDQGGSEDAKREATRTEGFNVNRSVENGKFSGPQTNPASRHHYIAE